MWAGALRLDALLMLGRLSAAAVSIPVLGAMGLLGLLAVLRANYRVALLSIVLPALLSISISFHYSLAWGLMNGAFWELLMLSLVVLMHLTGSPWPWWLALPAVLCVGVTAAAVALGQRLGLAGPVLGLSLVIVLEFVTLGLTLLAGDPRLGLAGVMLAIPNFLASVAADAAGPGQGVTPIYRFDLVSLASLLVCLLAVAVTARTAPPLARPLRRPARVRERASEVLVRCPSARSGAAAPADRLATPRSNGPAGARAVGFKLRWRECRASHYVGGAPGGPAVHAPLAGRRSRPRLGLARVGKRAGAWDVRSPQARVIRPERDRWRPGFVTLTR